jgi:hypothetical protein
MHRLVPSSTRINQLMIVLSLALMLAAASPGNAGAAVAQERALTSTAAGVGRIQISAESNALADAAALAERYGPGLTTAWEQFAALFASEPTHRFLLKFEVEPDPAVTSTMRSVSEAAWASSAGSSATIAIEPFLQLSAIESDSILRNLLSRSFMQSASGGNLPPGLVDGIARYVEIPVQARQARLGSLVQGVHQAGALPGWDTIITGGASPLDHETLTASRYALIAFFAQRYGIKALQEMVLGFSREPAWHVVIPSVSRQSVDDMNAAWTQFLPRWFASGWRENAVGGFDLTRAQSLFDRGAYEAAAADAGRSQQLFTDLNDQPHLRRVEGLLAQSAVGLQADQLMADAEKSLRDHDYPRALTLLDTVDALYATLPESHRPTQTVETYRSLAQRGLAAREQLVDAESEAGNWLKVKGSRSEAISAGETFSFLGDTEGLAQADRIVNDLDQRLHRLIFTLSSLTIIIGCWLVAWMWYRAPGRLFWRSPAMTGRLARRSGGEGRERPWPNGSTSR